MRQKSISFILAYFILMPLSYAKVYFPEEYPFPIPSAELATISSAIPYDRKYEFKKLEIKLFPERDQVYLLEGRNLLSINFLSQNRKAPLAFIISGVGGSGNGPVSDSLVEQFYEAGYHVVSIPNPISWNFVLGVSKSGTPGYLSYDVSDIYLLMKNIFAALENSKVLISDVVLAGYSQGAGILPALDQFDSSQEEAFGFSKVILLNPPMDFKYGIQKLDQFYIQSERWSAGYKEYTMGYLYNFASRIMKVKDNPFRLLSEFQLDKKQQEFVIGNTYRETLAEIIYTQELLLGKKILQSPVSWGVRSTRFSEAKNFSFEMYVEKILLPFLKHEKRNISSDQEIYQQYDFHNFSAHIKDSGKYYLFHNANDFLLRPSDIEVFNKLFTPKKVFIYPLGGHCGNYNFPINKRDLNSVLTAK